MPSKAPSTSVKPTGAVPAKRFELPALEFKFASLTDGTDIPPPIPSPIREEAPALPKTPSGAGNQEAQNGHLTANGSPGTSTGALKRPAEDSPSSPTLSTRPGSIRRLFSRNLLNNAYANGEDGEGGRPPSRAATSIADSKKTKRSSGWFGRFRNDNKRASMVLPSPTEKKDMGPPPPMIPELSEIKSKLDIKEETGFSDDLFKNIK